MTVTLVVGPPCAGKSTYVAERAKPTDLVVCWDSIALDLGAETIHPTPFRMREAIADEYAARLDRAEAWPGDVWIIRSLADNGEREQWRQQLAAEVVTLVPDWHTLALRAKTRPDPDRTLRDIAAWFDLNAETAP
jgi:hypothetical protein